MELRALKWAKRSFCAKPFMKSRVIYVVGGLMLLAAVVAALALHHQTADRQKKLSASQQATPAGQQKSVISAAGRVEPISEEIEVGAEVVGKIASVLVDEGDEVQRGQTLAILQNNDYKAQVAEAEARLGQAEAELRRVINGARKEERREALAAIEQADAVVKNAQAEFARGQRLDRTGDIPHEEVERAERDLRVAQGRAKELRERYALINAEAREEDVARAQSTVALSRAQVKEAQARLDKTFIRSPITGVVLRKRMNAGESVSLEMPNPSIFTVANTGTLRVRVDVDESDVARIHLGQRVYMMADAYGDKKFWGRVSRISGVLGKKNIRTEEPVERVDTKILETLVELEPGQVLLVGLRVNVFIIVDEATSPADNKQP